MGHEKAIAAREDYQFKAGDNGNGIVWALPSKATFPEPDACVRLDDHFLEPPKPPGALDDFMEAIDGDGSPWSYLCASVLKRELDEFGAMWHGSDWSTHTILSNDPFVPSSKHASGFNEQVSKMEEWQWSEPCPDQWRPRVEQDGKGKTIVRFLTFTALEQQRIVLHQDQYSAGTYRFRSDGKMLGTGPGGYVF